MGFAKEWGKRCCDYREDIEWEGLGSAPPIFPTASTTNVLQLGIYGFDIYTSKTSPARFDNTL